MRAKDHAYPWMALLYFYFDPKGFLHVLPGSLQEEKIKGEKILYCTRVIGPQKHRGGRHTAWIYLASRNNLHSAQIGNIFLCSPAEEVGVLLYILAQGRS